METILFSPRHPITGVAKIFRQIPQTRSQEAEYLLPRIQDLVRTISGTPSSDYSGVLQTKAWSYHHQGRTAAAIRCFHELIDLQKGLAGHDSFEALHAKRDLALSYMRNGHPLEAEILLREMLGQCSALVPEQSVACRVVILDAQHKVQNQLGTLCLL